MANRKQTPDVLGAVLGDPAQTAKPSTQNVTDYLPSNAPRDQGEAVALPSVDGGIKGGKNPPRKIEAKVLQPRQWEYMIVSFQDYRGWKPRFVNAEEVAGWKQLPNMPEYINQLGLEGWEMSGASCTGRNQLQVFFKRPKKTT